MATFSRGLSLNPRLLSGSCPRPRWEKGSLSRSWQPPDWNFPCTIDSGGWYRGEHCSRGNLICVRLTQHSSHTYNTAAAGRGVSSRNLSCWAPCKHQWPPSGRHFLGDIFSTQFQPRCVSAVTTWRLTPTSYIVSRESLWKNMACDVWPPKVMFWGNSLGCVAGNFVCDSPFLFFLATTPLAGFNYLLHCFKIALQNISYSDTFLAGADFFPFPGNMWLIEVEGRGKPWCGEQWPRVYIEVVESGWCLWLLLPDGKVEQGWMMEARTPPTPDSNHFHAQAPPICGSSPSVHPGCTIERWCSLWLMHYGTTSQHPPLHQSTGVLWPSLASSGLPWQLLVSEAHLLIASKENIMQYFRLNR